MKHRKLKKPRSLIALGMILSRRSKTWDSRKRREKDHGKQKHLIEDI